MRVFFCIFIKIITCGSASPFGSLHFGKAVLLLPTLSPSLPVSPDAHDLVFRFVYKLLRFVSFVLFLQRRKFLAILFSFFVYFYVLSKIPGDFFVQNKTRNTKRRIFLFFSSVVRKFLSISLFPLCPLFFVTALSPAPPEKPRTDFLLRSIFLSTAQKKTRISLSALPAAACVLRVFFCRIESFILAKSVEENSQHSRIFLFFRGKKTLFSQEFFSQFSRRKLAIYLLYIKR